MNNLEAARPAHAIVNRSLSSIRTSSGESFRAEIHRYGQDYILLFSSNWGLYGSDHTSHYPPQAIRRENFEEAFCRLYPEMRRLNSHGPKRSNILKALASTLIDSKEQDAIILPL